MMEKIQIQTKIAKTNKNYFEILNSWRLQRFLTIVKNNTGHGNSP